MPHALLRAPLETKDFFLKKIKEKINTFIPKFRTKKLRGRKFKKKIIKRK